VQRFAQQTGFMPTLDQWASLIEAIKSNKEADTEVAAHIHAQAMKKALRPENEVAPAISVYNPRGETKYPRPKPTHIYMMARYPICDPGNYDTVMWSEIELLNQVRPGEYMVTKADGLDVKVLVKTETDAAGKPFRTTLFADGNGIQDDEARNNWGSLLQILSQIVIGERPEQSYVRYQTIIDKQRDELEALKAQLATMPQPAA